VKRITIRFFELLFASKEIVRASDVLLFRERIQQKKSLRSFAGIA
jgi:hypothetical protein